MLGAGSGSLACLLQSWLGSGSLACLLESCRGGPLSVLVAGGRVLMTRRLPGNICRLRQSLNSGVAHDVGGRTHFLVAPPSAKVMSDFSGSASTPAPPNSMLAHTCFFLFLGGPRAYLPNIEVGGQGVGKKSDITFADACGILKINLDRCFWVVARIQISWLWRIPNCLSAVATLGQATLAQACLGAGPRISKSHFGLGAHNSHTIATQQPLNSHSIATQLPLVKTIV